jgi:RecA/RadA recombinase
MVLEFNIKVKDMTMAMDTNKQKALDMAIKQIDKTFGKGTLMRLGDKEFEPIEGSVVYLKDVL